MQMMLRRDLWKLLFNRPVRHRCRRRLGGALSSPVSASTPLFTRAPSTRATSSGIVLSWAADHLGQPHAVAGTAASDARRSGSASPGTSGATPVSHLQRARRLAVHRPHDRRTAGRWCRCSCCRSSPSKTASTSLQNQQATARRAHRPANRDAAAPASGSPRSSTAPGARAGALPPRTWTGSGGQRHPRPPAAPSERERESGSPPARRRASRRTPSRASVATSPACCSPTSTRRTPSGGGRIRPRWPSRSARRRLMDVDVGIGIACSAVATTSVLMRRRRRCTSGARRTGIPGSTTCARDPNSPTPPPRHRDRPARADRPAPSGAPAQVQSPAAASASRASCAGATPSAASSRRTTSSRSPNARPRAQTHRVGAARRARPPALVVAAGHQGACRGQRQHARPLQGFDLSSPRRRRARPHGLPPAGAPRVTRRPSCRTRRAVDAAPSSDSASPPRSTTSAPAPRSLLLLEQLPVAEDQRSTGFVPRRPRRATSRWSARSSGSAHGSGPLGGRRGRRVRGLVEGAARDGVRRRPGLPGLRPPPGPERTGSCRARRAGRRRSGRAPWAARAPPRRRTTARVRRPGAAALRRMTGMSRRPRSPATTWPPARLARIDLPESLDHYAEQLGRSSPARRQVSGGRGRRRAGHEPPHAAGQRLPSRTSRPVAHQRRRSPGAPSVESERFCVPRGSWTRSEPAVTDLTRLTAAETAASVASGRRLRRRGRAGAPRPDRRRRRASTPSCTSTPRAPSRRPPRSTPPGRGRGARRWPAYRSPSRTS